VTGLTLTRSRIHNQSADLPAANRSSILLVILAAFALCILLNLPAMASDWQAFASAPSDGAAPWRIVADKMTYDQKENSYTASGNVVIHQDDKTLSAEKVRFDRNSMEVSATGNVLIKVHEDKLNGDRVDINLNTGIGAIEKGLIFIEKRHFFIQGDKIEKTGRSTYFINQGSFTTCDGESPDWRVTGQDLNMTLEGYGTVTHATLWAKKIPVLYTPYLVFPVKLRRQSGLLAPQLGYSERNGAQFIQPLYWVINRSSDATFYYHHIQERGEKIGGEFRYALDVPSRGVLMYDSLDDRKIDDGLGDNTDDWGYSGDKALRTNHDRYWFRMKADQTLPYNFTSKLDLDVVSDQDYLREFTSGYTGYHETQKNFESQFGRDIDDKNDAIRENNLNISRIWTIYSFTTDVTWNDNVINRRQDKDDPTLQQLPVTRFNGLKQPLFNDIFYADIGSQYTYFYRQDGQTGHRGNLNPRLYLPYHYKNYVALEPSMGFLRTDWYVDQKDSRTPPVEARQNRDLYDVRCDLSTDVSKIFDIHSESIDKINHIISPKLGYDYIPKVDQTDYPQFDELDDIDPKNTLTFSITNLLTSKEMIEEPSEGSGNKKTPLSLYHQFCRFLIEQPYDFNKANQSHETAFEPLYAELDFSPRDFLTLGTETKWSHEKGELLSNNIFSRLSDTRGDRLLIEHRYTRDQSESIYFDGIWAVTQSLSIYGEYERNLDEDRDVSKTIGWLYRAQCWLIELGVEHEDNDKKIGFMIHLNGLGEAGNSL
jgi:LPS-assembly protein